MPLNKTRRQLPWLYYPKADRVIINAHNFPPASLGFGNELLMFRGPSGVANLGSLGGNGAYNGGMGVTADTGSGGVSAFDFVGASSQYLATPAPAAISSGSLGFWIKSSTAAAMAVYDEYLDNANRAGVVMGGNFTGSYVDESAGMFDVLSSTTQRFWMTRDGTDVYQNGAWHLIVFTCENAARKIYYDGVLKTAWEPSGVVDNSFLNIGATLHAIGRRFHTAGPQYLTARVDDFRVAPTIFTAAQVSAWYSAGRGYNV